MKLSTRLLSLLSLAFVPALHAGVVEIPYTGGAMIYNDNFEDATLTGIAQYTTPHFTWWYVCHRNHRDSCTPQHTMTQESGSWFISSYRASTSDYTGTAGQIARGLDFTIQGRNPAASYRVAISQLLDIKSADRWPTSFISWGWASGELTLMCNTGSSWETLAKSLPYEMRANGIWTQGLKLEVSYDVSPGTCPGNNFTAFFQALSINDVSFGNFEARILEAGQPL